MEFKRVDLKHEIRTRNGEGVESIYRAFNKKFDKYYECMKQGGKWYCAITCSDDNGVWITGPDGNEPYPRAFDTLRECKRWAEVQNDGYGESKTPEKPDPVISARYFVQEDLREERGNPHSPWESDWRDSHARPDDEWENGFEHPADAVQWCAAAGYRVTDEGVQDRTHIRHRVVKRTEEVFFDPTSTEHKQ